MDELTLTRPTAPLDSVVTLPGSKSMTNRAMIAAALADGTSILERALFADDTERMIEALRSLGFAVTVDVDRASIEITGHGGHVPACDASIQCGNSGTTIRFSTALASLGRGVFRFDGDPRMHERPIGKLAATLAAMGVGFEWDGRNGFPPFAIHADGVRGGLVSLDQPESSQFLTALLLIGAKCHNDLLIDVNGPLISRPYVDMTLSTMESFGVAAIADVRGDGARFIVPAPQSYKSTTYTIEPDASNASYFLSAPAIAGGSVAVIGLGTDSVQGDSRFVDVLEKMGCEIERTATRLAVSGPVGRLRGVDVDMNEMPDMVQTAAVLAVFAEGPTHIRNVANLRIKETNRLSALTAELSKLGAGVTEHSDGISIEPPDRPQPAAIDTYDDHRMAMSFALAGLGVDEVVIRDPGCVSKTYPDFFDRWRQLCRSQS